MNPLNDSAEKLKSRKPSHAEAVEICLMALTREQRRANISYWRNKYGDVFADMVQQGVIK